MTESELFSQLEARLGAGAVLRGQAVSTRHHVDFSGEHACASLALLRPATTAELATMLATCHAFGQRVVVQGGLTGLAGGAFLARVDRELEGPASVICL
jgi:FAD/FMN-containing dehydrogenase